jgi:N-acetyl-gamma-glutamyl-phosphate reductase
MKKINIGVIGSAGYTGGELLRLLVNHPLANIVFAHSHSQAGKLISDTHTDLLGETELCFSSDYNWQIDVLFLCVGHGDAKKFLDNTQVPAHVKIIDLSHDHRLANPDFVYGLPELNLEEIKKAHKIANPGCFATALQLALLPLAQADLLNAEINITATTGSTGAGQSLSASSHFSWRQNNLSHYKAFEHQHLNEIGQSILQCQSNFDQNINFIPLRGAFARGIFATIYLDCPLPEDELIVLFQNYYAQHPFVHLSLKPIDLKQVVNTNKCLLHVQKHGDKLLITSAIDNLLKGASGQAVQNMNLMFGLEQNLGLKLKANYF